jgi:hypothetical protein
VTVFAGKLVILEKLKLYESGYLFAVNELEPVALRRGGIFLLLLTPPALPLVFLGLRRAHTITLLLPFPFAAVI